MAKKIIALLSVLAVLFGFVSCSSNEQNLYLYGDELQTETTTQQDTEEVTEGTTNQNYYHENELTEKSSNSASTGHVHRYSNATCTSPKTCSCGNTVGTALGHAFASATCTSPQICSRCGEAKGSALGHSFKSATCTTPRKCTRCGKISGSALGHNYVNNKCTRCGKVDPDSLPVGLNTLYLIDYRYGNSWHRYYYTDSSFTDSFGNVYDGAHCYTGVYIDGGIYSKHNLNGKYSRFSGSIVAMPNTSTVSTYTIRIYVDDVLKFSKSGFSKTTGKVNFSVDVKGGSVLTIKASSDGTTGDSNMNVAIVNAQLTK